MLDKKRFTPKSAPHSICQLVTVGCYMNYPEKLPSRPFFNSPDKDVYNMLKDFLDDKEDLSEDVKKVELMSNE